MRWVEAGPKAILLVGDGCTRCLLTELGAGVSDVVALQKDPTCPDGRLAATQ